MVFANAKCFHLNLKFASWVAVINALAYSSVLLVTANRGFTKRAKEGTECVCVSVCVCVCLC
jgi:hypothetical protein